MKCPKCSTRNRTGAHFCSGCGAQFHTSHTSKSKPLKCPSCSFANDSRAKFCRGCGQSLAELVGETTSKIAADRKDAMGERRQLTVMFCDLVGSTHLSTKLDPEEHHGIIRSYQKASAQVAARYKGFVAQYLGDGIMVYFGYPQAHEDDAERAVHAALGIIESISALRPHHDVRLQVRIGIATGLVVVGDAIEKGATWEIAVVGESPNLAARMQGLAQPNEVVIAQTTRHLLGTQFDYEDLGQHALKGFTQPVQAWRVVGNHSVDSRFKAVHATGLTPLVDRIEELALLKDRGNRVFSGAGQIVLLGGEPGIGKSRLARALLQWLCEQHDASLVEFQCSPYHTQSPFFPVGETLQRMIFGGGHSRDDSARWTTLKTYLDEAGLGSLDHVLPLFANLLSIPLPPECPPLTLTQLRQRRLTRQYVLSLLLQRAREKPALLLVEDLHWADPTTMELMDFLVEQSVRQPLLGLFTFRPEFHPTWASRDHVNILRIDRLQGSDASELVRQASRGEELAPEIVKAVVSKTDGIPLYIEEFTKTVVESRKAAATRAEKMPVTIPASLHDLLLARLDRLGESRSIAQLMAMLGRQFREDLLRAVWGGSKKDLRAHVQRIVEAELIHPLGEPLQDQYQFKHALIQDAAYQSLLKSTRVSKHQHIAEMIERAFPGIVSAEPERVAQHYAAGKCPAKAISFWLKAGQQTLRRNAPQEAIAHLRNGLALLQDLPEPSERARADLDLHVALIPALAAAKGYAAHEVEEACNRVLTLCDPSHHIQQKFSAMFGLYTFHISRANHVKALGLASQLLEIAQSTKSEDLLLEAHLIKGIAYYWLGEYDKGIVHCEEAFKLYNSERHARHVFQFGQDPGAIASTYLSVLYWFLGNPDKSSYFSEQAASLARLRDHPFTLSFVITYRVFLDLLYRRDRVSADTWNQELFQLCTNHDIPTFVPHNCAFTGWSACEAGDVNIGITKIEAALEKCQSTGHWCNAPYWYGLLAMAYVQAGNPAKAVETLEQGFVTMERTAERYAEPELHRFRGIVLDRQDVDAVESERCFRQAFDLAAKKGAKGWVLRAAESLVHCLERQGKRKEAQDVVERVVREFPPEADSRDLIFLRQVIASSAITQVTKP
jgi:class 3 adenylate cyclase/tetratricopeptide (TPR) repeat protein